MNVLKSMLSFNPQLRVDAKQLLSNHIFDGIRNARQEQDAIRTILMPFEQKWSYDYENYKDNVPVEQFVTEIEREICMIRSIHT